MFTTIAELRAAIHAAGRDLYLRPLEPARLRGAIAVALREMRHGRR